MQSFPFVTTEDVVRYLAANNPARQKSINFFEPERGGRGNSPDCWEPALAATSSFLSTFDERRTALFWRYYFGDPRPSIYEIAAEYQVSTQTVRNWLNKVLSELERLYQERGLLPSKRHDQVNG